MRLVSYEAAKDLGMLSQLCHWRVVGLAILRMPFRAIDFDVTVSSLDIYYKHALGSQEHQIDLKDFFVLLNF